MTKQYKVICFYKDAPELCGEVYRNSKEQDSNLYSYEQALELIEAEADKDIYGFRLEQLDAA